MQGCLWCVYGCQRCISQPFSFISLPVSTVNALVNDKIRSFKAAFDLWWVQCNKIKSGVFRNCVLSKCFSVRLPRCFEKHPARHERNMKRKKKTSINDCQSRFRCWKTSHSVNDFSLICLKCTQKLHIYSLVRNWNVWILHTDQVFNSYIPNHSCFSRASPWLRLSLDFNCPYIEGGKILICKVQFHWFHQASFCTKRIDSNRFPKNLSFFMMVILC